MWSRPLWLERCPSSDEVGFCECARARSQCSDVDWATAPSDVDSSGLLLDMFVGGRV